MFFALHPNMLLWHPKPAPRIANIARFLLIIHGLANMAQGFYSITDPYGWRELAPESFKRTPDAAVQAIGICLPAFSTLSLGFYEGLIEAGLGALGIGWYQFVFACQNNRSLFIATIPLRIVYAFVVARWAGRDAVAYELVVWGLANSAAYLQEPQKSTPQEQSRR